MDATGADPLRAGDPPSIGPYRLLGRLGEGGMGTVYLAAAPDGRLVAVKVVKAEFTLDQEFAARFHAEVSNARKVASFCTAQVLGNGDAEDGRPYMVTEYIPGTPLSRQIAAYGPLEPGPLQGVALGMAAALAAIHVAGLVHRDLKPSNVILSLTGPRVIDFGIARALDTSQSFTQSGQLLGSPGWWAPEQVRGDPVTQAADVFAWGCVVAYAGSGRHPFGRGDVVTLAARVLNTRPDLGALPAPLAELTRFATDPDPARRPTAQDLLIALVSGAIPAATPPADAATRMLTQSWEPPANVADTSEAASADETPTIATEPSLAVASARPGPSAPPSSVDETTTGGTTGSGIRAATPSKADTSEADTSADTREAPLGGAALGKADTGKADTGKAATGETAGPGRPGAPAPVNRPGRSKGSRWLFAAAAVVAALAVTTAVLIRAEPNRVTATRTATPGATVPVGADVGRRIRITGDALQLIVPGPPRCGLHAYASATATRGALCVISWTLLNTSGGDADAVGATGTARLVDDRGGEHDADGRSTTPPPSLGPGDRADGVLIFDLPPGRRPALLSFAGVEVRV